MLRVYVGADASVRYSTFDLDYGTPDPCNVCRGVVDDRLALLANSMVVYMCNTLLEAPSLKLLDTHLRLLTFGCTQLPNMATEPHLPNMAAPAELPNMATPCTYTHCYLPN